jgi:hypothetical protein
MLIKSCHTARFAVFSMMLAVAAAAATRQAGPKPGDDKPVELRQQAIHIAYNEGDFDKVVAEIETFTKANKTYTRADSIFIAKHLAVVYSANPNTREKGKYYMYRLLEMVPSAELVDMFVSDEIDRIFDKVRKEFLARQSAFGVDSTQMTLPAKAAGREGPAVAASQPASAQPGATESTAEAKPVSSGTPFYKRKGFWMVTGAGVAAVGAVVTFVHTQEEGAGKSIVIDGHSAD